MYLHSVNVRGDISITFVIGESKLPPKAATTIPRMELCATVNAVQSAIANFSEMLKKQTEKIKFYSESKVVLGYINNEERRFAQYVGNRIHIPLESSPSQLIGPLLTHQPTRQTVLLVLKYHMNSFVLLGSKDLHFFMPKRNPLTLFMNPFLQRNYLKRRLVQVLATNAQQTNTDSPISALIPRFSRWRRVVNATSKILEAVKAFLMRFNTHSFSP